MPRHEGIHTQGMSLGRVLVVEDEQFTRTMLTTALCAMRFEVSAACGTARDALDAARTSPLDLALLDLDLGPGPSGIDVAHALRGIHPALGIVMLTSYSDPRVKDPAERRLPRGTRYIVKSSVADVTALRDVLLAAVNAPLSVGSPPAGLPALTGNQALVLGYVAAGLTNSEIAESLGVSEKAVERTIARTAVALDIARASGNQRVLLARAYLELAGKPLPSRP